MTTVDIDPHLVESARSRLSRLGYRPTFATMNSIVEVPYGPFDRIVVTVGIHRVPKIWLTVVKPGGVILANLYSDLTTNAIFALTVHGDGTASGRAPIGGSFMPTRNNIMPFHFTLHVDGVGERRITQLGGDVLNDFGSFYLFASLIVRDVQVHYFPTGDGYRPGLLSRDSSWAYELDGYVLHGGSRDLWGELERARATWEEYGRPDRSRLGITVTENRQSLWIDSPGRVVFTDIDAMSVRRI